MIKHIAMWRVQGNDVQTKEEVMKRMKSELEALNHQIEGMVSLEVGIHENEGASAYDVVLVSVHESQEALAFYQRHEKHKAVAREYVSPFIIERAVVDYICE